VKTDVESLSPTRVRLTIEVPFDELKPSLDKAYREVGRQVKVPGFRPGRVPPRIIDQRLGRGVVLEQAVNDALPELYGKAVEDNEVFALGTPEVEITRLDDGKELAFTAEVDIRPKFEIPELDGMVVTVDDAEVTPDDIEEYLGGLRERFASLKTASRPAESGDFVSIDLSASVDGREVEDAQASGLSYEIGSGSLLDGLDDALRGMTAGDSKVFTAELGGGEHGGEQAEVTVTVHSVKTKELPELDDEFAQSASEFDTLGELRAGTRSQLERLKRLQQASQARDRAMEALLGRIDIPLPDSVITQEVARRRDSIDDQLTRMGADWDSYLEASGKSQEELDAELESDARLSVKRGFVLDQLARQEDLGVDQSELSDYVVQQAERIGVAPQQLARQLTDQGQLPSVAADVIRAKALSLVAERAKISDASGREVDLRALAQSAVGEAPDDEASPAWIEAESAGPEAEAEPDPETAG